MRFLIAGIVAAAVSWVGNRAAIKLMGTKAIAFLSPLLEELAKSGSAVILDSPMVLTHGVFGLIEALYDARHAGIRGIEAGLISILGHLFYGYITYQVLHKHNSFLFGIFAGYLIHMLWNIAAMKFAVKERKSSK